MLEAPISMLPEQASVLGSVENCQLEANHRDFGPRHCGIIGQRSRVMRRAFCLPAARSLVVFNKISDS